MSEIPATPKATIPEMACDAPCAPMQNPQTTTSTALERVDLQSVMADKSLSLHKHLTLRVHRPDFCASVRVIDLAQVYITPEAKTALARSYITPAYLLDKFGTHYTGKVLSTITRGNLKGASYIDRSANVYRHSTEGDGPDLVVTGVSGERDGKPTREVHITCSPKGEAPTDSATANTEPAL